MKSFFRCLTFAAAFVAAVSAFGAARPDVLAIYYPHWHVYPRGNEWFHPGWTEWEYVRDSPARFPGHRQPLVPVHGYLDGKDPKDVAKEIDLAADAGIDVFLYDYYYYNGEVTQEEALEQGFLKASNRGRMKFAIMWCYHDRAMAWRPSEKTAERKKLMVHDGTPEEFLGLIDLCIERYFPCPEHYRKNGALYFSFYNPWGFIEKVGRDKAKAAFAEARRRVRAAGLGEIHFNGQGGKIENTALMEDVGFDSLTDYVFGIFALPDYEERKRKGDWLYDYGALGPLLEAMWNRKEQGPLPYYPIVSTGWDTSARMKPDVKMPVLGPGADYPYTGIYTNATAYHFGRYLEMAKRFVAANPKADLVQINAWNEYTEGCWLVPDNFEGDAKLRAIERTFGFKPGKEPDR